jgi:hypothetical protein
MYLFSPSQRCDTFKNVFSACRNVATPPKMFFQTVATLRRLQKCFFSPSQRCDTSKNVFSTRRNAATPLKMFFQPVATLRRKKLRIEN